MGKNLKIERHIDTNIKVGDKVIFRDGSALHCITHPDRSFIISSAYEEIFGVADPMRDLPFTVVETGVEDYIDTFEICNAAYLQDIVVEYNGVQFRTCSQFVTTELERGLNGMIYIDHLDLM